MFTHSLGEPQSSSNADSAEDLEQGAGNEVDFNSSFEDVANNEDGEDNSKFAPKNIYIIHYVYMNSSSA